MHSTLSRFLFTIIDWSLILSFADPMIPGCAGAIEPILVADQAKGCKVAAVYPRGESCSVCPSMSVQCCLASHRYLFIAPSLHFYLLALVCCTTCRLITLTFT
ncbi:hypothetical protein L226DRAFT_123279 [Lentinus tigrinus ALCF2SS1-7]|uniref:uncharacterized protein n=1 Tax=Lentinus tigrinus ALCF2SS1-7 TaxID=1328758 RepID=UPI001166059A|nr:hypothetical protein L226DRAFT_123279 [Lentinus tigrinus ALCF2SS1-7]